jgi:predicted AlkP superfamily pyrophosphatase or phosphodiesterase
MRRLLCLLAAVAAPCAAADVPRSLVVCLDGLRADAIGKTTPAIGRLVAGGWLPGYRAVLTTRAHPIDDAPTLSGPNHVAILTGLTASRSGVHSNAPTELARVDQPDYLELLKQSDPKRVTIKLAAWNGEGLVPTGADESRVAPDEKIVARAVSAVRSGRADALFLFLDGPDAAGHEHGFESDDYEAAVRDADRAIGRLLDAIAARPRSEDWQVIVTTDHGGVGHEHGGTSAEETLIPFLVASRHTIATLLDESVRNVDVTPTVLAHFGIDPTGWFEKRDGRTPYQLDGRARVPVTPR